LSADHDSGVLSIRPLGSTNQYSLVSGLPTIDHIGSLPSDLGFVDGQNITIEYRHDSGVLSIRPLGSTNQYSLVSGLPASRACTHLAW
jgi:hypothetical protein